MRGENPGVIPVVTDDAHGVSALPGAEAYEFFEGHRQRRASGWVNQVTIKRFHLQRYTNNSVEVGSSHNPRPFIPLIAPTPLLLTVTAADTMTPTDLQLAAFSEAREPKQLQLLPGDHFEVYSGPLFEKNASTQAEFLKKWLF